jgi:hypothetical protein
VGVEVSEQNVTESTADPEARDESTFLTRRQSLKRIATFAAATAPAMVVLLPGSGAQACNDDNGGQGDNGNHYGWEKGNRHSRF